MRNKSDDTSLKVALFVTPVSKKIKRNANSNFLDMMDDSVLSTIFSYIIRAPNKNEVLEQFLVDYESIVNLQCVCRRFYSVSSDPYLWQQARFSGVSKLVQDYDRYYGKSDIDILYSHLVGFRKLSRVKDVISSDGHDVCYRVMLRSTRVHYILKVPVDLVIRNERKKQLSSSSRKYRNRIKAGIPACTIRDCAREQELEKQCNILNPLERCLNFTKGIVPVGGKIVRIYDEYVTLREFLKHNEHEIDLFCIRDIVRQLLMHISVLHSCGIIHDNLSTNTVVIVGNLDQDINNLTIKLTCCIGQKGCSRFLGYQDISAYSNRSSTNACPKLAMDISAIGTILVEIILKSASFRRQSTVKRFIQVVRKSHLCERLVRESLTRNCQVCLIFYLDKFILLHTRYIFKTSFNIQIENVYIHNSSKAVDDTCIDLLELLLREDPSCHVSIADILKQDFFHAIKSGMEYADDSIFTSSLKIASKNDIILHHIIIEDQFFQRNYFTYINDKSWVETVDWCFLTVEVLDINRRIPFVTMRLLIRICSSDIFLDELLNPDDAFDVSLIQLVAVVCLNLASKIDGTSLVTLSDIVCCADNIFTIQDVMNMENKILDILRWEIYSSLSLLDFVHLMIASLENIFDKDLYIIHAHFFSEIALLSPVSQKYPPSILAVCCVTLVLIRYNMSLVEWSRLMPQMTGYRWEVIADTMLALHADLETLQEFYSSFSSVHKLYEKFGIDSAISYEISNALDILVSTDISTKQ